MSAIELILRLCEPWLDKHWRLVVGFIFGGIVSIAVCDPMQDEFLKVVVGFALLIGGTILGGWWERRIAKVMTQSHRRSHSVDVRRLRAGL